MGIIVEILLTAQDLPLVDLASSIPSKKISIENAVVLENQHYFLLVSIAEDSHDEFEDELDGQDEIIDSTAVGRTLDRWFYQLIVDDYPSLYDAHDPTQIDGVLIEATVTNEGGIERVLFSDYDEVREFQRRCNTAEIPFSLLNISSNSENLDDLPRFGLTDRQYEALVTAFRQGYYDSPRRASTEEIADELGVSAPAISKLLRRAERQLISRAVESEHYISELTS